MAKTRVFDYLQLMALKSTVFIWKNNNPHVKCVPDAEVWWCHKLHQYDSATSASIPPASSNNSVEVISNPSNEQEKSKFKTPKKKKKLEKRKRVTWAGVRSKVECASLSLRWAQTQERPRPNQAADPGTPSTINKTQSCWSLHEMSESKLLYISKTPIKNIIKLYKTMSYY